MLLKYNERVSRKHVKVAAANTWFFKLWFFRIWQMNDAGENECWEKGKMGKVLHCTTPRRGKERSMKGLMLEVPQRNCLCKVRFKNPMKVNWSLFEKQEALTFAFRRKNKLLNSFEVNQKNAINLPVTWKEEIWRAFRIDADDALMHDVSFAHDYYANIVTGEKLCFLSDKLTTRIPYSHEIFSSLVTLKPRKWLKETQSLWFWKWTLFRDWKYLKLKKSWK